MEKLQTFMDCLIALMFLGFAIYNIRESTGKIIRIDIKPIYNLILLGAGILFLILAIKIGGRTGSYFVAFSALFYLYTSIYCQGIGKDAIYVLFGKSTIRKIAFDDIADIIIDKEKSQIKIKADSTTYIQVYKKEDFERVLSIIENNR